MCVCVKFTKTCHIGKKEGKMPILKLEFGSQPCVFVLEQRAVHSQDYSKLMALNQLSAKLPKICLEEKKV